MNVEEKLDEELRRTEDALQSLHASFTPTDGIGFGKRVGDGTHIAVERIVDVGKEEVLLAKLDAIAQAKQALSNGTYGLCNRCGQAINPARLAIRPTATRCVACAGK